MVRVSDLLSFFVLGAVVAAAPPLLSIAPKPVHTSSITPAVVHATKSTAVPASTSAIVIPNSVIDAAPLHQISTGNSRVSIPGVVSNSTLVSARPDLQEYVNSANVTGKPPSIHKNGLSKRKPNPLDCNPNQDPLLSFAVATWEHIALKVCKSWYPNPSNFQYDPASPWPTALKSAVLGPINVGGGQVVTLSFTYGVNDWGLQQAYGWQPYYVPQSQTLCIADINTLIVEMDGSCAYDTGYDTSQDASGTGQPKWYTFLAS